MLSLERQGGWSIQRHRLRYPGFHIHHLAYQMRLASRPVVGDSGHRLRKLQHGKAVVALPNTQGYGFARVPALLLRASVAGALPLGRGQNATRLSCDIDAGHLTKTQLFHLIVDQVHTHVPRKQVVISVTGLDDGFVHVHCAVPTLLVIAETVVAKHEKAWVVNDLRR